MAKRPRIEVETNNEDNEGDDDEDVVSESDDSVEPPDVWDLVWFYTTFQIHRHNYCMHKIRSFCN